MFVSLIVIIVILDGCAIRLIEIFDPIIIVIGIFFIFLGVIVMIQLISHSF